MSALRGYVYLKPPTVAVISSYWTSYINDFATVNNMNRKNLLNSWSTIYSSLVIEKLDDQHFAILVEEAADVYQHE